MSTTARRGSLTLGGPVLAAVVAAALLAGCSGDDEPDEPTPTSTAGPTSAGAAPVPTALRVGQVAGRLPEATRSRVKAAVGEVVDGWLDAAYVGGDYPRSGFSDSWPGFTVNASSDAQRDADLMSNKDIGDRIDGVEVRKREVTVDVLSPKGRPAGATAHVTLTFRTTGQVERKVTVAGRLYLTHGDRGWKVFGYDITKEAVR